MGEVKVIRVVLDTNVIISALLFGRVPGELISLWKSGRLQPLASSQIIDEYIRVLAYPKFKLTEDEINFLLYSEILPFFDVLEVNQESLPIIFADPSDDKFLLCAEIGMADVIISGDRHLLSFNHDKSFIIMDPIQFIKKYDRDEF
jgi:putative PIN family toxin of toxin-antitoxin system